MHGWSRLNVLRKPEITGAVFPEGEASPDRAARIAGVGSWSVDLANSSVHWSDQACCIHEMPVGHRPTLEEALHYYPPDARARLEQAVGECVAIGRAYDLELPMTTAKGHLIWVRAAGEREVRAEKPMRMVGVFQDITDRKRTEAKIVEQHALMRITLDSIADAVITTDEWGIVNWLNPVAVQLTGWSISEALGQPVGLVFRVIHEATRQPLPSPLTRSLSEQRSAGLSEPVLLLARDGAEYGIQDSAAIIRDGEGESMGIVLVFHDVSEQRRLAREIGYRASRDALTGLLNRCEFEGLLERALAGARQEGDEHVLMLIDLDQFKIVNDTCGHAEGDRLLRQIVSLFQTMIRSQDTLARLGGDEFGIIMEHCTAAQARRVAERLCEKMESFRFNHDHRRFRVGASVGLVPLDARWNDIATVMQAADSSCYAAKEAGGNRVLEWLDSDQRMHERRGQMRWVTRIEEALEHDSFRLYGQRIAACTADASGLHVEVLLRLLEPDGAIIEPAAFMPAVERYHLASRVDRWVVHTVLDRLAEIPLDGVETVAINLSGQSLSDRSFHRYVVGLISHLPFDARKLCFEITETSAITHMDEAVEFINAIRLLGVRVALDDFGAGASSFGYLKHLSVDFLKIDGQFVRDLLKDELDRAAVRCFRDVAAVCGLTTIAEFVESDAIFAELKRTGIHYAQGHLIHRPEPLDRVIRGDRRTAVLTMCACP